MPDISKINNVAVADISKLDAVTFAHGQKVNNQDVSLVTDAHVLISTATAEEDSELTFHHGINGVVFDSTYDVYEFVFTNIHPQNSGGSAQLLWQANAAGGADFDENIQSTAFRAYHQEDGSGGAVDYRTGEDQATADEVYEIIMEGIHNDNDTSGSGMLTLYAPSSTTYVKHFMSVANTTLTAGTKQDFHGGYINTTSAIDEISFKMTSGNIDSGVIKMYGLAKS